jgi:hypothetical protein
MNLFFIGFLTFLAFSIIFFTLKNGIGPCFTSYRVKKTLLENLPNLEQKNIVDFGSGWGTLVFPLAKKFSFSKISGIENSWVPYFFSSIRLFLEKKQNLSIKRMDFFNYPLSNVDVLFLYLYPAVMPLLEEKILKEMKKGSLIITHTFAFRKLKPQNFIQADDLYKTKIFFYSL